MCLEDWGLGQMIEPRFTSVAYSPAGAWQQLLPADPNRWGWNFADPPSAMLASVVWWDNSVAVGEGVTLGNFQTGPMPFSLPNYGRLVQKQTFMSHASATGTVILVEFLVPREVLDRALQKVRELA